MPVEKIILIRRLKNRIRIRNGTILDVGGYGGVIETRSSLLSNQTVKFGNQYHTGVYFVKIVQGTRKQTLMLVKSN